MALPIPGYIGCDPHERAAVNVLADSLVQHSSRPLAITPIVAAQLPGVLDRERHPSQSTEFSSSRFLVPACRSTAAGRSSWTATCSLAAISPSSGSCAMSATR